MYSDEDREGAKGLDEFLAKVDEVGYLAYRNLHCVEVGKGF